MLPVAKAVAIRFRRLLILKQNSSGCYVVEEVKAKHYAPKADNDSQQHQHKTMLLRFNRQNIHAAIDFHGDRRKSPETIGLSSF